MFVCFNVTPCKHFIWRHFLTAVNQGGQINRESGKKSIFFAQFWKKKNLKYILISVFLSYSRIKLNAHLELPGQNHICHLPH